MKNTNVILGKLSLIPLLAAVTLSSVSASAAEVFEPRGERFKFEAVDTLISSAILYGQYIFGAIALLMLVWKGVKVAQSGNSAQAMDDLKGTLIALILGAILVYGGGSLIRSVIGGF